ncbi:hypothetical protein EYC80_000821 [Monilinia laxa]|uniref:EF-hand domain-containing protein n=1 Tax=Monilinia laxa TaxID=61186 RepID=A0A5N6K761_MONLA|nr:hypothetical protein EYC80_000821 [Monilinia laxa]
MSDPQKLSERMKGAGRKPLEKLNKNPIPTLVGYHREVHGSDLKDSTLSNATSKAEVGSEANRSGANQHISNDTDESERNFPIDTGSGQSNMTCKVPEAIHNKQSDFLNTTLDEQTGGVEMMNENEQNANNVLNTSNASPNTGTMTDEEFERAIQEIPELRDDTTSSSNGTMSDEEFRILLQEIQAVSDAYTINSNDMMTYEEFKSFFSGRMSQDDPRALLGGPPGYNYIESSEAFNDPINEGYRLRRWLRPGQTPRKVFKTAREKAEQKREDDEVKADAMEQTGKPMPKPKEPKPIKRRVHITVEEKDRLNEHRRALGMSGREVFTERPNLRGKRRKPSESELNEPEPQPKKQRASGGFDYGADLEIGVTQAPIDTNERASMATGGYAGFAEASDGHQESQGTVNSGSRYNTGTLTQAAGIDLSMTNIQGPERGLRHTVQGPNGYMEGFLMPNERFRPIPGVSRDGSRGLHPPQMNSEQNSMSSHIYPSRNAFPRTFDRVFDGPGFNHGPPSQAQIPELRSKRYRGDDDESAGVEDYRGKRRREN